MQPYSLLVEVQENVHTCAKLRQSRPTLCNAMDDGHQAPLSMGFSTQEYWSGLPCPSPGELPNPGIEPSSSALQADSLPSKPLISTLGMSCLNNNTRKAKD